MRHKILSLSLMALLGTLALGGCRESSPSRAPEASSTSQDVSGEELLDEQPNIDPRFQAEPHQE